MRTSSIVSRQSIRRHSISAIALALLLVGVWYILAPKMAAQRMRTEGSHHNATLLQQQRQLAIADTYRFGTPRTINLPRLEVNLTVLPGIYNTHTKSWTLDNSHAFIMSGEQTPATPIIYGHNMRAVFAKLDGVAIDELLRITMEDGRVLLYRYVDDLVVLPTDSSVLGTSVSHGLFLMTCTGPTFDDRRLLQFQYVGEARTVTYQEDAQHESLS